MHFHPIARRTAPVLASLSLVVSGPALTLTNGVARYGSLSGITVDMAGRCELWVTNSTTPLSGCMINLNSVDSFLVLPAVKPSAVVSAYLGQVRVSGATAVADSNCRVAQYGEGTIVLPHASSFQPLQVFTGTNFTGAAGYLSQYTAYTDSNLGAFANNISSFHLKRGYMATFAQNSAGTGLSRNFIAADGDLDVSFMPAGLDDTASFVRVFPWRWTAKKGFCETGTTLVAGQNLDAAWNYSWDINQNSTYDREYVAIRQSRWWPGLSQDWQARKVNSLLGYNEPDSSAQANIAVGDAIWSWPDLLGTGLRVGSPATTDGGWSSWLYPFVTQADAARLRVDFVSVHYYRCYNPADPSGAANQMYNALKGIYDQVKRPLWITEWNNGANWTGCADPTYAQQQACIAAMIDMLETTPFVERYAIYDWVEDVRRVSWNDGSLTDAGVTYRDKASRIGYVQDGIPGSGRGTARYRFEGDVLDSSGAGNNGIAVGAPTYAAGTNGQAIQFDGANSYVILPDNTANFPAFTFTAWIRWDGGGGWQRIFDFGNDTSHYLFLSPNAGNNALRFVINNGSGEQLLTNRYALPVGQWQHVAVTLSNTTARLYTNGTLAASSTSFSILPSNFNPRRNYLGKSQFSNDPLFRGKLDEVILAHYAMSAAEIASLATGAAPVFLDIGDGVWTSDANGNWSDGNRWGTGQPASGAGYTADFTFLDITANRTATLDAPRTIGALQFADASGSQNWTVAPSGTNALTLDSASAAQPPVVVNGTTATLSATLAGTNGLAKRGDGTLVLSGTNKLSGVLNIDTSSTTADDGAVCLASAGAVTNISSIAIRNNNSGSSTLQLSGGAAVSAPVSLSGRTTNVVAIENLSGSNWLSGNLTIGVGGSYYILQSDAGTLSLGGTISSGATSTRTFTFQGAGDHFVSGPIQNGSATTVNLLKQDGGNLILAGTNTFTGGLSVGGGAAKLNSPLTIQNTPVNLACAATNALKFGAPTGAAIGSLAGIGNVWLTNSSLAAVTLTNGGNNASSTFAGSFRGPGGIVKSGTGTLTLAGTNAHTGATVVAGGSMMRFGSVTNIIAAMQPALWLSFDSVTGSVVTNQGNGGWGLNGTLLGTGAYITNTGRFGNALYLDGTGTNAASNIVKIPSKVVDTSASASWTVGFWIRTTTAGAVILYQGDGTWSSSGQTTYYLNAGSVTAGGTRAGCVRWGGGWFSGTTALNDGGWHFITLVDTAGTQAIYVDGNADTVTSTMSGVLASGANQTWIGGSPDPGDGTVKMNGLIDEVVMFSRALTVAEIRAIYTNAPVAGKLSPASAVSVASGATLDLSGISQTVASLSDLSGGAGLVTNNSATPVTLLVSNNLAGTASFSGLIADASAANALSLVKAGNSTQILSSTSTFRGTTVVSGGTFILNGALGTNTVTASGGTLGGNGRIGGNISIQPAGTLSPGTSIGRLICSNNLTLNGTTFMELDKANATNDSVFVGGTLNCGGTLAVTNLGATLAGGDTFKLFSAASTSGNFSSLDGHPGFGLAWKFNPTNGILSVFSTMPAPLAVGLTNGTLRLSWPADHIGWTLQVQTNTLSAGLGTNWVAIPGSAAATEYAAPIDPAQPCVFYRLTYQ